MQQRYMALIKPVRAPPSWVFGPVWSVLYTMIAVSYGAMLVLVIRKKAPWYVLIPFVINAIANGLFTWLQFGLQRLDLALIDVGVVWVTIIWTMIVSYRIKKWICRMQVPYLLRVTFATVLQATIWYMNSGF